MTAPKSKPRAPRPVVAALADAADAPALADLFSRRGFVTTVAPDAAGLREAFAPGRPAPAAVIVDLQHAEGHAVLHGLVAQSPRPAVIGIAPQHRAAEAQDELLDSLLVKPVDPARLFVRVVELIATRRHGKRRRKLSGIVGAVQGNDLFELVAHELAVAVPAVNAAAILEGALRAMGTGPFVLKEADLAAMIASGRLAAALEPFGDAALVKVALRRVVAALGHRAAAAAATPVPLKA